ncbi:DUF1206 domain-containing protein [Aquisalinus flavus]|uniref:Membrane protein n=1 Tax=Aquisalinus flavus TaxID=1526572 RepID=A0A8J2V2E6_9PROT|nr:DUF1206 domain-containing protein [Aquisalinus flavus]MBD0427559.1 DUF1206 domain-containing protein [Aquisalinus flavus]UNE47351.1 DUF1206 domain-containing protein [Aquisalinus flavus]GGD01918.1 membrane protein [Aquisalinus flavus]
MKIHNQVLGWAMRIGYAARGLVYLIIGALAAFAAINGGEAEGTGGALAYLARQPFGKFLLATVAAGLFTYAIWRALDALLDLEDEGNDPAGIGNRVGQFMSGATHAVLGYTALMIVIGVSSGGGNGAEDSSEMVMNYPGGRLLVIGAGLTTGAVAIYLAIKSCRSNWKDKIRDTKLTEMLMPYVRFGLMSHGVVLLLIAGMLIWAGVTIDSDKAAGLEEALTILERQAFGRIILFVTGIGLIGFSTYCFVYAGYRIVPKLAGRDERPLSAAMNGNGEDDPQDDRSKRDFRDQQPAPTPE